MTALAIVVVLCVLVVVLALVLVEVWSAKVNLEGRLRLTERELFKLSGEKRRAQCAEWRERSRAS